MQIFFCTFVLFLILESGDAASKIQKSTSNKAGASSVRIPVTEKQFKRPAGADFKKAYKYFYDKLEVRSYILISNDFRINRKNIVEDTFYELRKYRYDPSTLKKHRLRIVFFGEQAIDSGGPTKEWVDLFSTEVFDPEYKLFKYSNRIDYPIEISPLSKRYHGNDHDYLKKFEMLGLFTGLAIYRQLLLNVKFSIPFLKAMQQEDFDYKDVERTDPTFYKNLMKLKTIKDLKSLDLKFVDEYPHDKSEYLLIKNGDRITVDEDSVDRYIRLKMDWKYKICVEEQMSKFLKGLWVMIPKNLLKIFTAEELQLVISGEQKIDVDIWKQLTSIDWLCPKQHIEWFWKAVKSLRENQRRKLLFYITSSTRLPALGTTKKWFKINCVSASEKLPEVYTCANRLDLPKYKTYDKMLEKLKKAIEYPIGFGNIGWLESRVYRNLYEER